MRIKKIYIDEASKYIEVEFDNGELHQLSTSPITKDEDYSDSYQIEMVFEK